MAALVLETAVMMGYDECCRSCGLERSYPVFGLPLCRATLRGAPARVPLCTRAPVCRDGRLVWKFRCVISDMMIVGSAGARGHPWLMLGEAAAQLACAVHEARGRGLPHEQYG